MAEEIEPCACCGKKPDELKYDVHPGPVGSNIKTAYSCGNLLCFVFLLTRKNSLTPGRWNEVQERIMIMRSKDFDAGYQVALEGGPIYDITPSPMAFQRYMLEEPKV